MAGETYSVIATIMKYWFILLILFILIRIIFQAIREIRVIRENKKDAYFTTIGYLEVTESEDSHLVGELFKLKRETYVGRGSFCDIRIKSNDLSPTECYIYKKGNTVFIKDEGSKQGVLVNDRELVNEMRLRDEDMISLFGVLFRVRLKGGAVA